MDSTSNPYSSAATAPAATAEVQEHSSRNKEEIQTSLISPVVVPKVCNAVAVSPDVGTRDKPFARGVGRGDDEFVISSLSLQGSPYHVLSVPVSSMNMTKGRLDNSSTSRSSRFAWFFKAFECCRSQRSDFAQRRLHEDIIDAFSTGSRRVSSSRSRSRSRGRTSVSFTLDTADFEFEKIANDQCPRSLLLESTKLAYGRIVITEDILIFDGEKKAREVEEKAQLAAIQEQDDYLPSIAKLAFASGIHAEQILTCRRTLSSSINSLELYNCSLSCEQLLTILFHTDNLESFKLKMTPEKYHFYRYTGAMIGTALDNVPLSNYKKHIRDALAKLMIKTVNQDTYENYSRNPSRLKLLFIELPYTKACSIACFIVEMIFEGTTLSTLDIRISQAEMLREMLGMASEDLENTDYRNEFNRLHCQKLLEDSRDTLRELSLSCSDRFPLDWCSDAILLDRYDKLNNVLSFKFGLTQGLLYSILPPVAVLKLNTLKKLSLKLPLLRILPGWEDKKIHQIIHGPVYQFMTCFDAFLASNFNTLEHLELEGLRVDVVMLPWLKEHFTAPKSTSSLGVMFYPHELKEQLNLYLEELKTVALIIPNQADFNSSVMPGGQLSHVFKGLRKSKNDSVVFCDENLPAVRTLHIVNGWTELSSFSVIHITTKFPKLSTLIIEDFKSKTASESCDGSICPTGAGDSKADPKSNRLPLCRASITNADLKVIIEDLGHTLKCLHLDCDMQTVSDDTIIGLPESEGKGTWKRMAFFQKAAVPSFCNLTALEYLFLKGLGEKVTDRSVELCFKETYAFPNLLELYLYAPNITDKGRETLRTSYAVRPGFILEMDAYA